MKKLYLQFIWHMHQPYYKDPANGRYLLPWVFLHAIKDYSEMPRYYELYDIKGTFNFVPSLLEQLKDYADENVDDQLLNLIKKDTASLSELEKQFLLTSLFMANLKNMISVSKRYKQLYDKYNLGKRDFDAQEILDLEVHFLTAWTGNFIRNESSFIRSLIVKDVYFTENDKKTLLKILFGKIAYLFDYYKKLSDSGTIELSVTPYYHPILPLLIDTTSAKQSKRDIALPEIHAPLGEDAVWHVKEGVSTYEKYFGTKPDGVWPAEGSVSNEALNIFGEDFKWCATDEDVLSNSLGIDLKNRNNRSRLYKRYIYGENKMSLFFRDKFLSDLLGFAYANMDPVDAACDFLKKLKDIYEMCDFDPVVSVIMDGENAWEFYKNNASDFFSAVYERVMKIDWITAVTPSEVISQKMGTDQKIDDIVAGSWIYGNFTTWIGHPEKNKAWEYLFGVKKDLDKISAEFQDAEKLEQAGRYFRIAEGSDWLWWYGDDHFTSQAGTFDYLFRSNLMAVYETLGIHVPSFLLEPIKKTTSVKTFLPPKNYISPVIDGKVDSYFEYLGASTINLKYDMSSMNTGSNILNTLKWGFDDKNLYLLIFADKNSLKNKNLCIEIRINCPSEYFIKYFVKEDYFDSSFPKEKLDLKFDEVLELSVDLELFETKRLALVFSVLEEDRVLDKAPVYSPLELRIDSLNAVDWLV